MRQDEFFMRASLACADKSALRGDVPVGAVVVLNGEIIATGENEKSYDPTNHAEIVAIRAACARLGRWNLSGCELFVTLEPCPMCAGAIVLARIKRVVFGCSDSKAGAGGTLYDILRDTRLNHRCEVRNGVLEEECRAMIKNYFRRKRV